MTIGEPIFCTIKEPRFEPNEYTEDWHRVPKYVLESPGLEIFAALLGARGQTR